MYGRHVKDMDNKADKSALIHSFLPLREHICMLVLGPSYIMCKKLHLTLKLPHPMSIREWSPRVNLWSSVEVAKGRYLAVLIQNSAIEKFLLELFSKDKYL